MKTKVMAILVAGSFVFCTAGMAGAVMLSPQRVVKNTMDSYNSNYTPQNMIDHSGLVTDFTSGVTDLTTYLKNTDHDHTVTPYTSFASAANTTKGAIDFDLGASYTLNSFLLWNDKDYQGIDEFSIYVSDDVSFPNSNSVRIDFLYPYGASYGYDVNGTEIPLQKFDLNKAKGRYVRLVVYDIHQGTAFAQLAQIAEIAFDATPAGVDNVDADGDGVIDNVDACVGTTSGGVVNEDGCSIDQICRCDNDWANHGEYVNCVANASGDFVADGLMSEAVRGEIVSAAAHSTCGQKGSKNK